MWKNASTAMKILIVGAGVGGMALAGLLRQRGIECEVVDRSADTAHEGHVITLYPMGSRILYGLGAFDAFRERSAAFRRYEVFNGQGELLHGFDLAPIEAEFGYTGQISRGDLVALLRERAEGVPIRFHTGLGHLEQRPDGVDVRFVDGTRGTYDGVVAADGGQSKVRRIVFGEEPDYDMGWGLWVWWTDGDVPRDTVREYWGKGRFVGAYPTRRALGVVAAGPTALVAPDAISSDGRKLREVFAGLNGGAGALVETIPDDLTGVGFWHLGDYRSRRWTHGRVALLGDAACSFLPTAGVGASMALESAAVMAEELTRCDSTFLPRAFRLYEKRRRHRAEEAQDESRKLAVWLAAEAAPLVWTRDQFLKIASTDALARTVARSLSEPI